MSSYQIKAGSLAEVTCSSGKALNKEEQLLPNSKQSEVLIFKNDGGNLKVAPLRAGQISFKIQCGDGQSELVSLNVEALNKNQKPKKIAPLAPEKFSYDPITFAFLFSCIFILVAIPSFAIWRIKKRTQNKVTEVPADPKQAQKDWHLFFKKFHSQWLTSSDESNLCDQFSKHFRSYIDWYFRINLSYATTNEFIQTLKSIPKKGVLSSTDMAILEGLLLTFDQIRFAGRKIAPPQKEKYLKDASEIYKALKRKEPQDDIQ